MALVSRICATTATMHGDADAFPSFDVSRFVTCTDGIGQAARLPGHTRDRDESMTLLRPAPAQSPHGRTHGDRIRPVSARHLLRRPRHPNASRLLRNTMELERSRFRFADGEIDREELIAARKSCRKVVLAVPPDTSPHWGPERSLVSGRPAFLRHPDITASETPGAVHSEPRRDFRRPFRLSHATNLDGKRRSSPR